MDRNKEPQLLLFLFLVNALNFYDRQLLGAITEPLRKEWQWNDLQIGMLSTGFTIIYAFTGIPLGRWADRRNRQYLLCAGVALWSLFTGFCGMAWNYGSLFIFRLGVGIGEASLAPCATSLIGEHFGKDRISRAMSIYMLGLPVGSAASYAVGGYLAQNFGWRWTFLSAAIPGILLILLGKNAEEKRARKCEKEATPVSLRQILAIPSFPWIILSGAIHNFNLYALSAFLPAFLIRYHGMQMQTAGLMVGLAYAAMGGVGMILGGEMGDRLRLTQQRTANRLMVTLLALIPVTPLLWVALDAKPGQTEKFALFFGMAAVLMYVYYPNIYAVIQEIAPEKGRGTAMALYFMVMYFMGAAIGPTATGWLSDYFRGQVRSIDSTGTPADLWGLGLHRAMYLIPVMGLLLLLVLGVAWYKQRKS